MARMKTFLVSCLVMAGCGGHSSPPAPDPITTPRPVNGFTIPDAGDASVDPCSIDVPIECPPDTSHVIMGPLCVDFSRGPAFDTAPIPTACLCNVTCACVAAAVCGNAGVLQCTDNPIAILCN